jgi:hypothetical protein
MERLSIGPRQDKYMLVYPMLGRPVRTSIHSIEMRETTKVLENLGEGER